MGAKLAGILLLSLFLGLISSLHFENQSRDLGYVGYDESVYYSLAKHILETSPLDYTLSGAKLYFNDYRIWYIERPIFHHPPLFTWLLAVAQLIIGPTLFAGRLLNVLLGMLNVYVVYLLAIRLCGDERVALTSSLFLALSPLHVQLSSLVLMDELLMLMVSLFVLSTVRLTEEGSQRMAVQAGVFLGLALLTKYPAVLATAILAYYAATRKIPLRLVLTTVVVAFAMNSWWLAWNLKVYSTTFISSYGEFWRYPNTITPFHAYLSYLPIVAPAAILGYVGVGMSIREKNIKATGIASVVIAFLGFFTTLQLKEMRFVLPTLPLLFVSGSQLLFKLPAHPRKVLTAIVVALSLLSTYVVAKGGYYWYLPLWHYQDWLQEFLAILIPRNP